MKNKKLESPLQENQIWFLLNMEMRSENTGAVNVSLKNMIDFTFAKSSVTKDTIYI